MVTYKFKRMYMFKHEYTFLLEHTRVSVKQELEVTNMLVFTFSCEFLVWASRLLRSAPSQVEYFGSRDARALWDSGTQAPNDAFGFTCNSRVHDPPISSSTSCLCLSCPRFELCSTSHTAHGTYPTSILENLSSLMRIISICNRFTCTSQAAATGNTACAHFRIHT